MDKIKIVDLYCKAKNSSEILKGVNLEINKGDIIAFLGPNGHGKSTLLNVLMGDPTYKITKGKIYFDDVDITSYTPDQRSKLGMFLSFQSPISIPGVVSMDFFKMALNAHKDKPMKMFEYYRILEKAYKDLNMDFSYAQRFLNDGFSGGERKKNEILQMNILKPDFCMLDEIDSGLDVDALNIIADNINALYKEKQSTFLIISHYSKLYSLVKPNRTIVIIDGKIVLNEDGELAKLVSENGYSYLSKKYNIRITKQQEKQSVLGTCGNKVI